MVSLSAIVVGYLLDLLLGDPHGWPHPVRWIGSLINSVQTRIRRYCRDENSLKWGGLALWLSVVGLTYFISWGVLALLTPVPWLQWLVETALVYTILATKCLDDAATGVYRALKNGSLSEARTQLSYIVGRDTTQLEQEQISRATVETVAENSVDGVIAPLFFLFIGGVPLAMAYKAVNTLDSMVGYKTPKYRAIGYFSARLDDAANYIPARLSWLLLTLAAALLGMDYQRAVKLGWRDRYQHTSPNCAWPEATVAGALGVRLGGSSVYFGQTVEKPWLGEAVHEIEADDIRRTIRLMYFASALTLIIFTAVSLLIRH